MFTGIIEEVGTVKEMGIKNGCGNLVIRADKVLKPVCIGDSIAVNGVCLTVNSFNEYEFAVDVMAETVRKTNLALLKAGSKVNLERAMQVGGRFGGHIVSGHVDGIGKVIDIKQEKNAVWVRIQAEKNIIDLIVNKGSVTLDGISLTVAKLEKDSFSVSIIPHTAKSTTILSKKINDVINIENDMIGKYVKSFMDKVSEKNTKSKITTDFLSANGFM
ncbi:MAG: riboflavin synthase [Clostridium sp.]|nr:riboflavin synthase [Clostridium sp.]